MNWWRKKPIIKIGDILYFQNKLVRVIDIVSFPNVKVIAVKNVEQ